MLFRSFGASIWPFQWEPPYDAAIRRLAGLGFRATELIAWNKDFLADYYTPSTIAGLRTVLDGEGVGLSQFVSTPHDLSSADPARRDAAVEHWKRTVDVGVQLGAPIINMVSSHPFAVRDGQEVPRITTKPLVQKYGYTPPAGLDWDANYRDYVAAMRRCADACAAAGVLMSVEPHPGRYLANTDGALRLLEHALRGVATPDLGLRKFLGDLQRVVPTARADLENARVVTTRQDRENLSSLSKDIAGIGPGDILAVDEFAVDESLILVPVPTARGAVDPGGIGIVGPLCRR